MMMRVRGQTFHKFGNVFVNVSPNPTSRINPSHPSAQILGDPTSAVQTRSKVNKSSKAHAFVSYVQKQKRNNHKGLSSLFICLFFYLNMNQEEFQKLLKDKAGLMQCKKTDTYVAEILKKFDFVSAKTASTPIETHKPLVKDEEASEFDVSYSIEVRLVNALRRFRESLRRVTDGAEAFLILTLFILCLDKVSNRHAKLLPPAGKVTPLFDTMLVQPTQYESLLDSSSAQPSEVPYEQQPDPSPRPSPQPSPTPIVPDSIPEPTGENLGDHSSNDTSLSGNEDGMTLQNSMIFVSPLVNKDSLGTATQRNIGCTKSLKFSSEGRTREMEDEDKEFDEDSLSTEDEVSTDKEGVSTDFKGVSTNFEKVSTDRPILSTDGSKVSTDEKVEGTEEIFEGTEEQREGTEEKVESTAGQIDGTEDQTKEEIATTASQKSTQTPTSMIFGDDETIATLLLNMSKAKAASKEKEKGVELKDVEEIDRPRPTSTRSLLTLKPLPKIDTKDKGKKKIEEEDESESEDDDIPQAVKKFKQLESDEEMARKIQENGKKKKIEQDC
ncbi:hypothetical protein Tco_0592637 [Tanacetum coccineum]